MTATTRPFLLRAADIAARAERHDHPWSARPELAGTTLGRALGTGRTGTGVATRRPPVDDLSEGT